MKKLLPKKLAPQTRALNVTPIVDVEKRTMEFPFSSEEPCDMWYGTEVLSHAKGAMRQGARQESMPFLYNHNRDDLLGVIESISIDGERGVCVARFGKDERGDWAMKQAEDGVLKNVSFMYRVFKMEEDSETDVYTATDWEPYEISLVTVPADPTVGVGRSVNEAENEIEIINSRVLLNTAEAATKEVPMEQQATAAPAAPVVQVNEAEIRTITLAAERKRMSEVEAMCRQHNMPAELRENLIKNGNSIEEARGIVLEKLRSESETKKTASLGNGFAPDLTDAEKGKYSLLRAIEAHRTGNWKDAGFELEVSNDIGKRMGKTTGGFFMPTTIPFAREAGYGERAQYAVGTSGSGTTGGTLVATNLLADSFIDVLRNKAKVLQLGATMLSGLVGNVDIPRQTGAATAYWLGEKTAATESEGSFDKVSLSLKTIGALSAVTRNMMMQSTPAIEMLVRADLIKQLALGIDAAALYGTGSSNQPLGISNQSGIGSVIGGVNGAAITIDNLIDLETALTSSNVDEENLAYLTNAKVVGALKKLKSTTGQYLWTNNPIGQRSATPGEINGYEVARTNQARSNLTKGTSSTCSEVYFGNWSELLIGEWGALEIVPNMYDATLFGQGGITFRALQSVDVGVRHAASFSVMSDALTA